MKWNVLAGILSIFQHKKKACLYALNHQNRALFHYEARKKSLRIFACLSNIQNKRRSIMFWIKAIALFVLIFLLSPIVFFLLTKLVGKYFKLEQQPDSLIALFSKKFQSL